MRAHTENSLAVLYSCLREKRRLKSRTAAQRGTRDDGRSRRIKEKMFCFLIVQEQTHQSVYHSFISLQKRQKSKNQPVQGEKNLVFHLLSHFTLIIFCLQVNLWPFFLNLKTLQDISRNYAPFPETLDTNVWLHTLLYKLKPNFDLRCHTKATKSNTTTTTCYCSEKWCMWCFMKKTSLGYTMSTKWRHNIRLQMFSFLNPL